MNAFFLGTHNSHINVRRVISRVTAKTGHFVEESEVKRRWDDAQKNLVRTAALFDQISVIDSSTATTAVVVEFSGESITPPTVQRPIWAAQLSEKIRSARKAAMESRPTPR